MGDLGETAGTGEETRLFTGDGTGDGTGFPAPVSPHSARNSLRAVGQHGHCSIDGVRTDHSTNDISFVVGVNCFQKK